MTRFETALTRLLLVVACAALAAAPAPSMAATSWPELAMGDDSHGQLGDGGTSDAATPVQIQVGGYSIPVQATFSAGGQHNLVALPGEALLAWGANDSGQLGDGTHMDRHQPATLPGFQNVKSAAAGGRHSLAVQGDGTVWAWGANDRGQLGSGTTAASAVPNQVTGLRQATNVAAGARHSLAGNGDVAAWGANDHGQLGDGTTTDRATPVQVSGLAGVTMIAAGGDHSLALGKDGTVWAWGANDHGQLGDGTTIDRHTPVQVGGLSGIVAIAAGARHNLARDDSGALWAWGANDFGQVGDGTTTDRPSPVRVRVPGRTDSIAAGGSHSLATALDPRTFQESVWGWGSNAHGQLGIGVAGGTRLAPVQLPVSAPDSCDCFPFAVAAGGGHSLVEFLGKGIGGGGEQPLVLQIQGAAATRATPPPGTRRPLAGILGVLTIPIGLVLVAVIVALAATLLQSSRRGPRR